MGKLNRSQIMRLQRVKQHLHSVKYYQYKMPTTKQENEAVAKVMEEVEGEVPQVNWACASCVYNAYLKVANWFYDGKEN